MKDFGSGSKRTLLCLALAAASIGTANAGVELAHANSANKNVFSFDLANPGSGPVENLQVFLNGNLSGVSCAGQSAQGSAFSLGGTLLSGDSVACSGMMLGQSANMTALGKSAGGVPFSQTAHAVASTAATGNQAIVGILMGAVYDQHPNAFVVGNTISMSYTIYNLGNVALSNILVSDLVQSDNAGVSITCPGTTLAVGASMVCTGQYVLTAIVAGNGVFIDNGSVSATDPGNATVTSQDSVIRTSTTAEEIRGLKSPLFFQDNDNNGYASVGDLVQYTFAVKNSGDADLTNVDLVEPDTTKIDGAITCNATTVGNASFSGLGTGTLVVGDSVLCSATHTITSADVTQGQATNLANISGTSQFSSATGTAASKFVVPPPPPPPAALAPTPVNDWRALMLLALGLLATGFGVTRRRKQHQS